MIQLFLEMFIQDHYMLDFTELISQSIIFIMQEGHKKIIRTTKIVTQKEIVKEENDIKFKHITQNYNEKNYADNAHSQMSEESFKYSKSSQIGTKRQVISDAKSQLQFFNPNDIRKLQQELNQLKTMELSEDIRQKLIKMQRFDRLNYLKQTERILKQSIQAQMKRLEKIKNEKKQMRIKYYDNELTITCLHYHHKLISQYTQLSNSLQENKKFKAQLEKKNYQLQNQLKKQRSKQNLKSLQKSGSKSSTNSQTEFTKQLQTSWNFSLSAISNQQFPQALKQMSNFIQKCKKNEVHYNMVKLMEQTMNIININLTLKEEIKNQTKYCRTIVTNVQLLNKHLRQQKWGQIQKLKNRINEYNQANFLSLLIENIQSLKKSRSNSNDKNKISQKQLKKQIQISFQKEKKKMEQQIQKLKFCLNQKQKNYNKQKNDKKLQMKEKNQSQTSSTPSKVNLQELKNLQSDFNQLSRLKEEEEFNFLKLIEEKDERIKQYEHRLNAIDKIKTESSKQTEIITIQLQEKSKEILALKKQLIRALQQKQSEKNNIKQIKQDDSNKVQKQMQSTCKMIEEILKIKIKKQEEIKGKAFQLQLNSLQREQWRQVSKKIKQYKKIQPKNKYINFIDQKHKREFDLVQKLIDYEDKTLLIHNHIYKGISITSKNDGWWNNKEILFCKQKTQFANLFNKLMLRLFETYSSATFQVEQVKENNFLNQYQEFKKQIDGLTFVLKELLKQNDKIILEGNYLSQKFNSLIKEKNLSLMKDLSSIFQTFLKKQFQYVAKYNVSKQKQLQLTKKQNQNFKISQTNLQNQVAQLTKKLNLLLKENQNLQKRETTQQKVQTQNFNLKTSLQQAKKRIKQLQQQNKKYSYYKELIEEQEKIVDVLIVEQDSISELSSSSHSQTTIKQKGYGNFVTVSTPKSNINQNNKKQQTQQFIKKYPKNKVIQYLVSLRTEVKRYQQEIIIKQQTIEQLSTNLDLIIQNFESNKTNLIINKKNSSVLTHKTQKLNELLQKNLRINEELKAKNLSLQKLVQTIKVKSQSDQQLLKQVQVIRNTMSSLNQRLNQAKQLFQNSSFFEEMYQAQIKKKGSNKRQKQSVETKLNNQRKLNLLQTIFSFIQKVSQIHLSYEADLIQKINQNQIKYKDEIQKIKDQNHRTIKQLADLTQKLKLLQKQNKGLIKSQSAFLQVQNSYQQLKQNYNMLLKSKNQDQSQIRQLQIFKKELEQQRNFIDKFLKGGNDQQKKQLISYKKNYPKSKFVIYLQSQNKKNSVLTSKISSLEVQSEKFTQFCNNLNQMINQDQNWFKKDINNNLPNQTGFMLKQLVKSFAKSKNQVFLLRNQLQNIAEDNVALKEQQKQFKNVQYQMQIFSQILQNAQKSIQKPKQDLFINQFYLKNLIDLQIKKKKLNFQPIYTCFSQFVRQLSIQYSTRQTTRNQKENDYKKKIESQKQGILIKTNQLNLKCKQMEIINKELSTQNKLIKQSLAKLQSSSNFLDQAKKSLQSSQRTKQYEILRLKQTIETYVKQETRLQMQKNKLEKEKKQFQKVVQKLRKELDKVKEDYEDLKQEKIKFQKLLQNLRQNSINLQNNNQQNQIIITTLKQNYSETQRQLKSIQFRITSLLQEKQQFLDQIKSNKNQIKNIKNQSERQINSLKSINQKLENQLINIKRECQGLKQKARHHDEDLKIQKNHLQQTIKKIEKQLSQSTQIYEKEKKDLTLRIQMLSHQKDALFKQFDNERTSYRQKIFQINLIGSNQNDIEHSNLRKQIQDLNKKYQENIKYYQLEKQELRKYIEKVNSQYQESLIKNNSERKKVIDQLMTERQEERKQYQHQLNESSRKNSEFQSEVDRLVDIIESNKKSFNQILASNIALQKKNIEYQIIKMKMEDKIANLQKIINQNQQNLVKLGPLQRRVKQFDSLVQLQTFNSQLNSRTILQAKLNQLQLQKKNNQSFSCEIAKLNCEITKLTTQNQLIQAYSKNNRQEYLKFMSQSKQNIRDLKQQNKFLVKEKNTYQNQLSQLNHLIKTISQKNQTLTQQLKKKSYQVQINPIQGELKLKINFIQLQLKQKQSEKHKLQNQLLKQKAKILQLTRQNNNSQKRNVELISKLKQLEYQSQFLEQRQNLNNNSEVLSLNKQISSLKTQKSQIKIQYESQTKTTQNLKKDLQQSKKQINRYQFQIQSSNKINAIEHNHLKQKIMRLQQELNKLNQIKKTSSYHLQSTYVSFNRETQTKIRDLQYKIQVKNKHLQVNQSKIQTLQKNIKELQRENYSINRLVQQLQRKNQQKLKQINQLSKQNMENDIKFRQIERNWKYFQLQSQRSLQFQKRINKELQEEIQSFQKQAHHNIPFSPSTHENKESQQEKIILIKQINKLKKKNQQSEFEIQNLRRQKFDYGVLLQSITKKELQMQSFKCYLSDSTKTMDGLSIKNNNLINQNNQLKSRCKFIQEQNLLQKQKTQIEKQKVKNIERVLQHEIMEYKSKLQNVEAILKQQKQKTYHLRIQLQSQRYKDFGKIQTSDNNLKYIHNLQIQCQRYQANVTSLQKRCYQYQTQLKILTQSLNVIQQQNQNLKQHLFHKQRQLAQLTKSSQQTMNMIVQQNLQIKQLLKQFQRVYQLNLQDQYNEHKELNILMKISSQIQKIILKNKQLQKTSKGYQQQLNLLNKSNFKNNLLINLPTIQVYLQNIIEKITSYFVINRNFEKNFLIKEYIPSSQLKIENTQEFFNEYENYLKYLYDLMLSQFQQSKIKVRYEIVIQKMKQVMKNYLKTQSLQLKKTIEEMVNA